MKRFLLSLALVLVGLGFVTGAEARTRVSVFVGGGGYYDPYWGPHPHFRRHHHRHFHPGFVYAPAPVIVEPAPIVVASPSVAYVAPPAQSTIPANQTSPTFTDEYGRTCRAYETTRVIDDEAQMVSGKACIFPDGAWRVVE